MTKSTKVTLTSLVFVSAPVLRELAEGETHSKTELKAFEVSRGEFFADASKVLADYLAAKTASPDDLVQLLTSTIAALPAAVEAAQASSPAALKAAAKAKAEAEAAEELKAREQAKADMLARLLAADFDLATAQAMVMAAQPAKRGKPAGATYDRVNLTINGVSHDVPVKGNISTEIKAIMAAEGLDRDGLIAKYKTVEEAAE